MLKKPRLSFRARVSHQRARNDKRGSDCALSSTDFERSHIRPAAIEIAPSFPQAGAAKAAFNRSGRPYVHVPGQRRIEGGLVATGFIMMGIQAARLDFRGA